MKIAIIGQKGIPAKAGGIERYAEEVSIRLVKQGFEVLTYNRPWYTGPVKDLHKGVRLVQLGSIKTKHFDTISHTFMSILHAMKENVDVYHFMNVGPSLLSWIPRIFRPQAKVITTFQCLDRKHQKWGAFARFMLHVGEWTACTFAHKTIVVSKTLTHYVREVYGNDGIYIPNGMTPPKGRATKPETLKKFGLQKGKYAVMVSRLVRHKSAHTLIEAWKKLKASTPEPMVHEMKLVFIGDAAFTDDYAKECRQLADNRKDIVFTGLQTGNDLHALMAGAAFGIHPSLSEGQPMSVLELMSYAKAVLVSDIPEHLEIIEGRGFTFRAGNVKDLMLQLYFAVTHPRACLAAGLKAERHVCEYYDWDDVAKGIANVYREVAGLKKGPARDKNQTIAVPAMRRMATEA